MKEMVGGCCVCSDESGWDENPLVYCDGQQCTVAVHKACYGIVLVPKGPWFCRKCESQERLARVRCDLCPSRDGALKRTDAGGWAHVVCSLYIPEVRFGDVKTMEPIILESVPSERYHKTCYICEERGRENKAKMGACMQCNKVGCKQYFHVTCAQSAGLLCEEAGKLGDNVKFCGYCKNHYQKIKEDNHIKTIPAFKPVPVTDANSSLDKRPTSHQSQSEGGRPVKKKQKFPNFTPASSSTNVNNRFSSSLSHATDGEKKKRKTSNGSKEKDKPPTLMLASFSSSATAKSTTTKETLSKSRPSNLSSSSSSSRSSSSSSSSTSVNSPPSSPSPIKSSYLSFSDSKDSKSSKSKPKEKIAPFVRTSKVFDSSSDSAEDIRPPTKKSKTTVEKKRLRKPSLNQSTAKEKTGKELGKKLKKKREDEDEFDRVFAQQKMEPRSDFDSTSQNGSPPNRKPSLLNFHEKIENKIDSTVRSPAAVSQVEHLKRPDSPILKDVSSPKELSSTSINKTTQKSHAAQPDTTAQTTKELTGTTSNVTRSNNVAMPVNKSDETPILPRVSELNSPLTKSDSNVALVSEPTSPDIRVTNNFVLPSVKKQTTTSVEFKDPDPPRSLEQLLERQWTQTAQFLMDQPQHFDIASLLSCLNQLRSDNEELEDRVRQLLARRDHLIAVNSRLSVSLNGLAAPNTSSINSFASAANSTLSQFGSNHSSTSVISGNSISSAINGNSNFFNAAANLLTNNGIPNASNLPSTKHTPGVINGNGTYCELNNNNAISGEKSVSNGNGTTSTGSTSVPPTNGSFHFANSIAHNLSQFSVSVQPTISFPASSISSSLANSHTSSPLNNVNCSNNSLASAPSLFQSLLSQQNQKFGLSASHVPTQRTHSKR